MAEFFGSVWWLVVTLGLLVTFHEYGHYVVARRLGVKVLRFSVGFGKPLAKRVAADGTEFVVAAIPLGGYVKMLDEREGDVEPEDLPRAFNRKPVLSRIAIVAAGPAFNLVFAVFAFWVMFVVGRPDFVPIVGKTEGIAAQAGLREDDVVLSIDGTPTPSWTQATIELIERTIAREDVRMRVRGESGERELLLPLSRVPSDLDEDQALRTVGIRPKQRSLEPVVADTSWRGPAAKAGVIEGDRIVAVNGERVATFDQVRDALQKHAQRDPAVVLRLRRGAEDLELVVKAERIGDVDGKPSFRLGIEAPDPRDALLKYGPLEAVPAAFVETWRLTRKTFQLMGHLVFGRASLKNVSGPIGIAQSANFSAELGLGSFIFFLAVMSLSIGILNLLPIPILDGGHLLYYLIELVKGSPVTERTAAAGQYLGLALLIGLMGLAFYNDILRLIS